MGLQLVLFVALESIPISLLFATHTLGVAFYSKMTTKEQFLIEHNKLSPLNLQATASLLSRFRIEKAGLFKYENWPIDKIRRPFLLWLTSLSSEEKKTLMI